MLSSVKSTFLLVNESTVHLQFRCFNFGDYLRGSETIVQDGSGRLPCCKTIKLVDASWWDAVAPAGNMEVHYICCFTKFGTRKWTGTSLVTKTFAHQSHHSWVHQDQLSDHPQLERELVHPRYAKCWVKTCVDEKKVKLVIWLDSQFRSFWSWW